MPKRRPIDPGESAATVAAENGLWLDTLWADSGNDALRDLRSDPYQLCPGDVLTIPDREPKEEPAETGKRHSFRRRGVPDKLTVQLLDGDDKPYAKRRYFFEIDGRSREGITSPEGVVDEWVPPLCRGATVTFSPVEGESERLVWTFEFNTLPPVDTGAGFADRLANLGLEPGSDESVEKVVEAFQRAHGLTPNGEVDDAEIAAMALEYGS